MRSRPRAAHVERPPLMPSFPRIADLAPLIETAGWQWTPFTTPSFPRKTLWRGKDRGGNCWLTKLRGDFYAYREIVFARLAQKMNWSCQSSVFIRIDKESAHVLEVGPGSVHAANWFLEEHAGIACGADCNFAPLVGRVIGRVEDLVNVPVAHVLDWPKSEMAACLFGGNEPPGHLITQAHEFVIIDSEQMFSTAPSPFDCTRWWGDPASPHPSGVRIGQQVCADFLALSLSAIDAALEPPSGIQINERWPIAPLLRESVVFAQTRALSTSGG